MENKNNIGKKVAYFIGAIAIVLSGIVIYNYNLYIEEENIEIENYIYLEPEVNFVKNLTAKKDQKVKMLDFVKNSQNCVILDKDEYVDTTSIGKKECILKVTDDIGNKKEIKFNVEVVE